MYEMLTFIHVKTQKPMSNSITLEEHELAVCCESAWPFLCPDDLFENHYQRFLNETGEFPETPSDASVAAILGYSKALKITKKPSGEPAFLVVLN